MQLMVGHLRQAFYARLSEWEMAVALFIWGLVLLMPEERFDTRAYAAFREHASEEALGALFLAGGAIRLCVLFANGAWRPMYYVRAWMAFSTMIVWILLSLGFLAAGIGTWIAIYPVFAVFEAVNVLRAVGDAAQAEKEARHHADPA